MESETKEILGKKISEMESERKGEGMSLVIKIFLCFHQSYTILPPLCIPIQCGAEGKTLIKEVLQDNIGEHISGKNQEYCELTAQYYAWKQELCDYYGFCHYRRFFCFEEQRKKPYLVFGKLKEKQKILLGTESMITELCQQYEIILPYAVDMGVSVIEQYQSSLFHYGSDLKLFIQILKEKYPELKKAAKIYLSQNKQYFCNMFLMDRIHFQEYCTYLFGILEEFDQRKIKHGSFQADRTNGYLGERFVGIYLEYAKEKGAKIKEVARMDIDCTLKKRLIYSIFPPESKRRFFFKKEIKRRKGKET